MIAAADSGRFIHGSVHFETCLAAALEARDGTVIKVEMKREQGAPVYEFNIRDNNARDWDVECHADTAEIIEIEREVTTPLHPDFQKWMHIDEDAARKKALAEYPGDIVETEYEIESDGRAVYEFDILQPDGTEWKIEIDSATGEVHEADREYWQIGYE
ncbi:MAG: PepSY domain-containing protein [Gammaproteobacteria bacterium]|nr:PepSY domain-containing protein [Gammaproteobacteria bacterium]